MISTTALFTEKNIRPVAVDVHALKLSGEEGFVLSRIDGPLSLRELVSLSGLEEAKVIDIVVRLAQHGALDVDPEILSLAQPVSQEVRQPSSRQPVSAPVPARAGPTLTLLSVTHVGMVRTNNEDALAVLDLTNGLVIDATECVRGDAGERGVLLLVSDGMGGANAGEVASALVIESIREHLAANPEEEACAGLASAVAYANAKVIEAADVPGRDGMGATVVGVLVRGHEAFTAEIGDSRAYLLRNGVLTRISKDQTHVQLLIDQGLFKPEDVAASRAKNILIQAIGKAPELTVVQRRIELRASDRLLLCSDGLTGHVSDEEIARALATMALDDCCTWLINTANERGGKDNTTILVAELTGALSATSVQENVNDTIQIVRELSFGDPPPE